MNATRESIYSGIFNLLTVLVDGQNFKTLSRKTQIWDKVPIEQQPALFMQQLEEDAVTGTTPAPPTKYIIKIDILIYAFGSDPCQSITPFLNNCVDLVTNLFAPGKKLALPGVLEARVNGKIEYGEGLITGQGVVVIPIRIVAA